MEGYPFSLGKLIDCEGIGRIHSRSNLILKKKKKVRSLLKFNRYQFDFN